ncbi:helix-turn-helix domain-containing protein [Streptomyces sp. NBC_01589]|uniref:helix-turn-helix domain-containing protein n=1 Tax=Streptomyces sp. NBC_01589 TaxID=2975886 RepID=UPI00386333C7
MPNAVLRHPRLSLTARGLLGHLLSLPDGSRETVQTIAEKVSEGRVSVRKAMAQLETEGFLKRVRRQDREAGTWSTEVTVSDTPMTELPTDSFLTVGGPSTRSLGRSPKGVSNQEKNPTPTPKAQPAEPVAEATEGSKEGAGDAPQKQETASPEIGRAAAVLSRLGASEAKLTLSAFEAASLAPGAAEWLIRGVSELELKNTLIAGLPDAVHAPARFVAGRLERKMPAARRKADPAAPAVAVRAECGECGRPLALGQSQGICGRCAGVERAAAGPGDVTDWRNSKNRPGVISPILGRAKLRAALAV